MQPTDTKNGGSPERDRFHGIYDAHASDVAAFALRRCRAADAADIVAETFVVAWRRIVEVPDEPKTRPWLLGIARRAIADQARGQRRQEHLATQMAERFEDRYGGVTPTERLEQLNVVGSALQRLSDDDRELLLLVAWDQLQPSEIGILLGVPGPVIRKRLQRARKRFRQHLADLDDGWTESTSTDRTTTPIGFQPNPGALP